MRTLIPTLLLCGSLALMTIATADAAEPPQQLDAIVAVVDDDVVLASELDREVRNIVQQARAAGQGLPPMPEVRRQVLERLVLLKLQLAAAERAGISVEPETLQQAIASIASRNNLTIEQMRGALAADGIPFDIYREQLRQDILLSRLRSREILNRIQISSAEIDAYLTQESGTAGGREAVQLRHILIAVPDNADSEARAAAEAQAQQLLERLKQGEDFASLAQENSDGRQAESGGDLGWLPIDQVPSLFEQAAATLGKGEVAGPLQSGSGFHIVQLVDYKGGDRNLVAQTHVRHILITPNELVSDSEARTRLEQLRQRISDGDDFATLARSHSDDKGSAIQGGDLGWVNPGDLVPRFEEVMKQLAPGELGQPVRTRFGWHLIQVLERRQQDVTDQVRRAQAREALRERKAAEATRNYLRQLRNEAYVELRLDEAG
jgi:peptidyl-prolyl cis-trans isomerase SurA